MVEMQKKQHEKYIWIFFVWLKYSSSETETLF